MDISNYVKVVEKQFKKKFDSSDTEFKFASEEKPITGIIVDNPLLEYILDRRFLAYGRFYLCYGKKGSSKTSLFFDLAKLFQRQNGLVVWLETENAADKDYAAKQGVDLNRMVLQHPQNLEQALNIAELYIRNLPKEDPEGQKPVLICLDSIAGSTTEYEMDQSHSILDTTPGSHARILSRFYREMEHPLATEKCIFLALNQLKEKIGGFGWGADAQDSMIGGNAPLFSSTCQWKLSMMAQLTATDEHGAERKVGSTHKIECKRNKLGREGKGQDILFNNYIQGGIDWYSPLVKNLGEKYSGLVRKAGAYVNWVPENTKYIEVVEGEQQEHLIDTEKSFREHELAQLIAKSPEAKEIIRKAFGIPDLPSQEEVNEVEEERLTKRKKKKTLSDEDPKVKATTE
jgi:recombination protein RecA